MKRTLNKLPSATRKQRPTVHRKKTVLLAVSGMSPAILTETVWRLAYPPEGNEGIIPDEVVVITTSKGAEDIQRDLLNRDEKGVFKPLPAWNDKSVWETLRQAVLGPSSKSDNRLQLRTPRIIELPNPTGATIPAPDLRTPEDNAAAADFILREVRSLVDPDTNLIASIAGGRKTMGALLYACMSLLGRETDRVTHVLVKSPFDDCRGFFFPGQPVQDLVSNKDKQPLRATKAEIELADIPFVPLINRFHDLAEIPGGFMGLVRTYSDWLKKDTATPAEAVVRFDQPTCSVTVNDMTCKMEGRKALEILRFVFEANQRGWVNDGNSRDFGIAAEFFKASRGIDPHLPENHQRPSRTVAEEIRKTSTGHEPEDWIKSIDSHRISTAISALRSFLKHKHSRWAPYDRQWRLPPFRLADH